MMAPMSCSGFYFKLGQDLKSGLHRYEGIATVSKNWLYDTIVFSDLRELSIYTGMDVQHAFHLLRFHNFGTLA